MKPHSRFNAARRALLFWCLFIGIGAVAGAVGMLAAPDGSALGMEGLLPYFQVLPLAEYLYQDFVFPGIALLCVNGIPNLIAAALLFRHKKAGIILGGIFGLTLMAWITIQFVIFPANFMSTTYFIFGFLQAAAGLAAWIFYKQERFLAQTDFLPHAGTDHSRLVVYFSRMGYTKKAALEEARRTGADVYEVRSTERTEGTLGFWWCGRFGMHRWDMPIAPLCIDLSSYRHVTVCSPSGCSIFRHPCAASAGRLPAKSGKRIISSFIIKGAVIKMPLRKWMPCSGFAGQGLRAFAAGRAPRCAKLPFTQRRKPNRRLAEFRPLSANEWQETSSDFFSDFVTYPL